MAEFLWGIAQHVNDPSSDLISLLRRHLCRKGSSDRTETKLPDNQKKTEKIPSATVMHVSPTPQNIKEECKKACCSKSLEERAKYRSTYAQVDLIQPQPRQVHEQWPRLHGATAAKTTSTQQIAHAHQGAGTHSDVYLKDTETHPTRCRVCPEHRHVFKVLEHWSYSRLNEKEKIGTALDGARTMLHDMLKYFKLNKIENLPEYCGPDKIFMLYRCTNMENRDENETCECIVQKCAQL